MVNLPGGSLKQNDYMWDPNIERHNAIVGNQQFALNKIQEWLNIINNKLNQIAQQLNTTNSNTKTRSKRDLSSDTNNYQFQLNNPQAITDLDLTENQNSPQNQNNISHLFTQDNIMFCMVGAILLFTVLNFVLNLCNTCKNPSKNKKYQDYQQVSKQHDLSNP